MIILPVLYGWEAWSHIKGITCTEGVFRTGCWRRFCNEEIYDLYS